MVFLSEVIALPEFHRKVLITEGGALDAQQRGVGFHFEQISLGGVGHYSSDVFYRTYHMHAEYGFKHGIHGSI